MAHLFYLLGKIAKKKGIDVFNESLIRILVDNLPKVTNEMQSDSRAFFSLLIKLIR